MSCYLVLNIFVCSVAVLLRIQRLHLEQVKVALPIVLGVLNAISSEDDEKDFDTMNDLFIASLNIGHSIQEICQTMEGQKKEELCAILGLYTLQNIALLSRSRQKHIATNSSFLVTKFSQVLPFCGLSYFGLLTGSDYDELCNKIHKVQSGIEDDDEFMDSFAYGINGSCLAVIWAHISEDVAKATGEQLIVVFDEIRRERSKRWNVVGMLKHMLSSIDYSWEIKSHVLDVLLSILYGIHREEHNHYDEDFSIFMPNLFASLKAIEKAIMEAPYPLLRKKAFSVFKKVVSDIPSSQRFDILKALIVNSNSSSMIAILIDLVKDEVLVDTAQENSRKEQKCKEISPFWGSNALAIIEMVLRPPNGGPPSLPDNSEPVCTTLQLFCSIILLIFNF
ncbi:Aberrant root formation protein 4 [Apostasia shenzhenica]|uniref:Aberrant root formation protein 4 n=1 Tax=Apostasia shenzhenica TaxID=1088818 RepID=A0A2H9ZU70_9ASPA|nr:Aberrant root formation protein 4 [Apostasia shenzhenica]